MNQVKKVVMPNATEPDNKWYQSTYKTMTLRVQAVDIEDAEKKIKAMQKDFDLKEINQDEIN